MGRVTYTTEEYIARDPLLWANREAIHTFFLKTLKVYQTALRVGFNPPEIEIYVLSAALHDEIFRRMQAGATPTYLPPIESVAAAVHSAWVEAKLAQGYTSRRSESGEELMVPYEDLSEEAKALDRSIVKATYEAIRELFQQEN